tara:strand:+ start:837 stop:1031 length:195 start_codon:yes stop_codon:yes gene_type:complete
MDKTKMANKIWQTLSQDGGTVLTRISHKEPVERGVCRDHKSKAPRDCCREAVREAAQADCKEDS